MKWQTLSEASSAALRQLAEESRAWLGRGQKVIRSLRALARLGEPAAIPSIAFYLFDDDPAVAAEAAVVVETIFAHVSPELLPILDERIRADYVWGYENERWRTVAATIRQRFEPSADHAVALGIISCHPSGYVREAVIDKLDHAITSGVEIPFLLLRLTDWVPAVREAAERAVGRRITASNRATYLAHLSLIETLKRRVKGQESPGLTRVENLLREDVETLVAAALASHTRGARRFGLSLALATLNEAEGEVQDAVLKRVIHCSDPAARVQVTRWLATVTTAPQLQRDFLATLLHDRSVAVRRIALGWCATREPVRHLESLRAALLDRSSIIRAVAQFHLPKHEPVDLRSFYRDAVARRESRVLQAALGGLGETGQREDSEVVISFVDAPEVKIRKASLAALAKLALDTHLEIFVDKLQSASPGVSRQARIALDRYAAIIGADKLGAILTETPHVHVRRQTLGLINRLSKWQKLPLLIQMMTTEDSSLAQMADDFVRSWLSTYNRTHQLQPSQAEVVRLRRAMDAHGPRLDGTSRTELRAILELFEGRFRT